MTSESMTVVPDSDDFRVIFPQPKPLIGTIHLDPLPGAPKYRGAAMTDIVDRAVADARRYVEGGFDGLIVENEGDIPYLKPDLIGPETVAGMTAVTAAVVAAVDVPVGVLCLANANLQSLAIAKCGGASFIRTNQWANAYVANEGIIEGSAAVSLRYRSAIQANDVRIIADVHVKHGSHAIVADRSITELTHDTEAFGADALIATGQRTGDPTTLEEVDAITHAASRPVLVGSGLTADNAGLLLSVADGAIVGSAAKEEGVWWNPVSVTRTRAIVDAVKETG